MAFTPKGLPSLSYLMSIQLHKVLRCPTHLPQVLLPMNHLLRKQLLELHPAASALRQPTINLSVFRLMSLLPMVNNPISHPVGNPLLLLQVLNQLVKFQITDYLLNTFLLVPLWHRSVLIVPGAQASTFRPWDSYSLFFPFSNISSHFFSRLHFFLIVPGISAHSFSSSD